MSNEAVEEFRVNLDSIPSDLATASLYRLPNEILHKISAELQTLGVEDFDGVDDKTDLLSICLVSKRLNEVGTPLLYRTVTVNNDRIIQARLLLRVLIEKPHFRGYVHRLNLTVSTEHTLTCIWSSTPSAKRGIMQEDMERSSRMIPGLVVELARRTQELDVDERSWIFKLLCVGLLEHQWDTENAFVVLLLHNLKVLKLFENACCGVPRQLDLMPVLALLFWDKTENPQGCMRNSLNNLKKLWIIPDKLHRSFNLSQPYIEIISRLPALEDVVYHDAKALREQSIPIRQPAQRKKLRNLTLDGTSMSLEELAETLSSVENLAKLEVTWRCFHGRESETRLYWDVENITAFRESLDLHIDSLRTLRLDGMSCLHEQQRKPHFIGSLKGFKNLEVLEIDDSFLNLYENNEPEGEEDDVPDGGEDDVAESEEGEVPWGEGDDEPYPIATLRSRMDDFFPENLQEITFHTHIHCSFFWKVISIVAENSKVTQFISVQSHFLTHVDPDTPIYDIKALRRFKDCLYITINPHRFGRTGAMVFECRDSERLRTICEVEEETLTLGHIWNSLPWP